MRASVCARRALRSREAAQDFCLNPSKSPEGRPANCLSENREESMGRYSRRAGFLIRRSAGQPQKDPSRDRGEKGGVLRRRGRTRPEGLVTPVSSVSPLGVLG